MVLRLKKVSFFINYLFLGEFSYEITSNEICGYACLAAYGIMLIA